MPDEEKKVVILREGIEKRGGQNATPTKPKPNNPPPAQKPKDGKK